MAGIQQFNQKTVFTNPKLPKDTLSSEQFNTLIEVVGEGEIEGSATASKAGLTKGTTEYNNAFKKDIFLNGTQLLLTTANNSNPAKRDLNFEDVGFEPRFGTSDQKFIKGIKNIVAGDADALLVPNVETGNALVKMMIYFMGACAAGVVVGGKVPVVITSRSDDATARLASIAAAVVALD